MLLQIVASFHIPTEGVFEQLAVDPLIGRRSAKESVCPGGWLLPLQDIQI